jgi:outer membrane PBP1 activator LpoA protein
MRLFPLLLLFMASCAQIKPEKKIDESEISPIVKQKLDEARDLIRESKPRQAMAKLSELNDNTINPVEKALKYNLKGVTLFNLGEVDKSILNFEVSEKYAPHDTQLYSQLQLNMASGFFKLNQYNELKDRLSKIDQKHLNPNEQIKYAQLALAYATKVENHLMIVSSSLLLLKDSKTFAEIQSSNLYQQMKLSFSILTDSQKIDLLEEFNKSKNLGVAQLAQIEAEQRYLSGDKNGAQDVISWLNVEFAAHPEVSKFIKDFEIRLENSVKISISEIGVVLPLSGEKAQFGQKALSAVDTSLKILGLDNIKVHTKDSVDYPAQGAQAVLELIREKRVSFIIGGLFPETAKAEYLEARKYGVLYISLSSINLPKEEKNHNLIEVQGSIESQIETLLSEDMIKKFGPRIGVIYPDNESGKSYVDEIWRQSSQKNLQITSIASFPKNTHDYRDTAQLFLGLKYPRERSEELRILDDVYALEKTSIRRLQTLPPVLDFDWVFLATFPHEATQLIPTLGYYDASRIKIIGGPSWVSKSMVKEQKNLGTLYFVGDDPKDLNRELLNKFQDIYGKPPGLIEILALDAMKVGSEVLRVSGEVGTRDEFDSKMLAQGSLKGISSEWVFKDKIWIKKMNAMAITKGEVVKLFEAQPQTAKEEILSQ